ncbi:hypothetical protein ACOSP7_005522 [Xanthoceras sorbifolium]
MLYTGGGVTDLLPPVWKSRGSPVLMWRRSKSSSTLIGEHGGTGFDQWRLLNHRRPSFFYFSFFNFD